MEKAGQPQFKTHDTLVYELTVRVDEGIVPLRFLLTPFGESQQLCSECDSTAIGGSEYLNTCPDHLDAPFRGGPMGGTSDYDVSSRLSIRLNTWEKLVKEERAAASAAAKKIMAGRKRQQVLSDKAHEQYMAAHPEEFGDRG